MRYLILFVLPFCLSATLVGQDKRQIVAVQETASTYRFTIRTDKAHRQDVLDAFNEISGNKLEHLSGKMETELDNGIALELNTRRSTIRIEYRGEDPTVRQEAEDLAEQVKNRIGS